MTTMMVKAMRPFLAFVAVAIFVMTMVAMFAA
jgi:hypothetical protein